MQGRLRTLIKRIMPGRYAVLFSFVITFMVLSFIVRLSLFVWSYSSVHASFTDLIKVFFIGAFYDIGVASFFVALYNLYLLLLPQRINNSVVNRIITYILFSLLTLIALFSFFAEFPFWQEFKSRFNFIAVDYLVYTFEVIQNINQSYPLPLLISCMVAATIILTLIIKRISSFERSFTSETRFKARILPSVIWFIFPVFYISFVKNSDAEINVNRYQNELSKSGVYSFFAAFRDNELNFEDFYLNNDIDESFGFVTNYLKDSLSSFDKHKRSIYRRISGSNSTDEVLHPNVIMITVESFSAEFMGRYGNTKSLTPFLDSISKSCICFDNLYATGTRTVRGMEALSLCIPPTPGNSIVRRNANDSLFVAGSVFKQKGYECSFIYGGDGYFDNMNEYFGNNGFNIVDRSHGRYPGDNIKTTRTQIEDKDVHFENAWGICDEDLYDAAIRDGDARTKAGKNFYQFIMTTSNHRPFTFPNGRIDIPSGQGREGAVKYTDHAIRRFITNASLKPWFKNTVFIIVADHCAESAGVNEIDITKYHIPCLIYNMTQQPKVLTQLCSQIDIYPTLFSLLGWNYDSNFFGRNVLTMNANNERAFVSTYQKLGYLKGDQFVILNSQRKATMYKYDPKDHSQVAIKADTTTLNEAIAWYQTASYLFKTGSLKLNKLSRVKP